VTRNVQFSGRDGNVTHARIN